MLVTDVIARDHRAVQALFFEIERVGPSGRELLERLVLELEIHAQAEEAVFYPAVREVSRRIDDAEFGHEYMRQLVEAVQTQTPGSEGFLSALRQLKQTVLAHAMEEESGIFMDAERLGLERLGELGGAMEQHRQRLMAAQPAQERRVA
jgi:hemerythrin superfamily protein